MKVKKLMKKSSTLICRAQLQQMKGGARAPGAPPLRLAEFAGTI